MSITVTVPASRFVTYGASIGGGDGAGPDDAPTSVRTDERHGRDGNVDLHRHLVDAVGDGDGHGDGVDLRVGGRRVNALRRRRRVGEGGRGGVVDQRPDSGVGGQRDRWAAPSGRWRRPCPSPGRVSGLGVDERGHGRRRLVHDARRRRPASRPCAWRPARLGQCGGADLAAGSREEHPRQRRLCPSPLKGRQPCIECGCDDLAQHGRHDVLRRSFGDDRRRWRYRGRRRGRDHDRRDGTSRLCDYDGRRRRRERRVLRPTRDGRCGH